MNADVTSAIIALSDARGGQLLPEEVVEAARDKRSPLHAAFEWSNSVAAEAYRVIQARVLIRSVRIEVVTTNLAAPHRVPLFANNPDSAGYLTLSRLREDPDKAREAAIAEFARASAALRRAKQIAIELGLGAEAVATVDALVRGIQAAERDFPART